MEHTAAAPIEEGAKSSWASLFGKKRIVNTALPSYKPQYEEEDVAIVPDNIVNKGIKEWSEYVVGYFVDKKVAFSRIKETLDKVWKGKLKAGYDILTDKDLYFFKFDEEEDKRKVLEESPLSIAGRIFLLRQWHEGFEKERGNASSLPLWVNLYDVPRKLWTDEGIGYIASMMGVPICMDEMTSKKQRTNFARVCVEIAVSKIVPEFLKVKAQGEVFHVRTEFPWKPIRCLKCLKFGHSCQEKKKDGAQTKAVWAEKEMGRDVGGVSSALGAVENNNRSKDVRGRQQVVEVEEGEIAPARPTDKTKEDGGHRRESEDIVKGIGESGDTQVLETNDLAPNPNQEAVNLEEDVDTNMVTHINPEIGLQQNQNSELPVVNAFDALSEGEIENIREVDEEIDVVVERGRKEAAETLRADRALRSASRNKENNNRSVTPTRRKQLKEGAPLSSKKGGKKKKDAWMNQKTTPPITREDDEPLINYLMDVQKG